MNDKELFNAVFARMQERYTGLEMRGTLVYHGGECQFNTDGFNLLCNLKRLCDSLADELY